MTPGFFITFEGIEGSGKTTQIQLLADRLIAEGREVVVTREPGGTPVAEQIRNILLEPANTEMTAMTELLLIIASRRQHVEELIRPVLDAGKVVLCDRFSDATVAYQQYGRQLEYDVVQSLIRIAENGVKPQLTLLLDLPVENGLKRVYNRAKQEGSDCTRFEYEAVSFHERIRKGYLAIAQQEPERVTVLDSRHEIEQIHRKITEIVNVRLGK